MRTLWAEVMWLHQRWTWPERVVMLGSVVTAMVHLASWVAR